LQKHQPLDGTGAVWDGAKSTFSRYFPGEQGTTIRRNPAGAARFQFFAKLGL